MALGGEIVFSTGSGDPLVTWNATELLGPLAVVTLTLRNPAGVPGAIAKFAVICVAEATGLEMVIPAMGTIVAPVKLAPVRITETFDPATPLGGVMPVSEGASVVIAKRSTLLDPEGVVT